MSGGRGQCTPVLTPGTEFTQWGEVISEKESADWKAGEARKDRLTQERLDTRSITTTPSTSQDVAEDGRHLVRGSRWEARTTFLNLRGNLGQGLREMGRDWFHYMKMIQSHKRKEGDNRRRC